MKRVAVIGGGVAGMQTALRLAEQGIEPVIIEKEAELGGKLRGWHVLFPSFTPAQEVPPSRATPGKCWSRKSVIAWSSCSAS